MKKISLILIGLLFIVSLKAKMPSRENQQDTISQQFLEEVVVSVSTKETNNLKTLPASISVISPQVIEGRKIINIKDLSSVIPNFFIPDYGSKLSVPVYIRGIGERSTGQSIGMYIDNMPYLDKSVFDFEFMDISQIEVLRGPQGTLYGRNAMSGIINIKTRSPLQSQYGKVSLTAGNYGLFRVKAIASERLADNIGLAFSGYYDGNNGYFTNQYSGQKADELRSAGTRIRLDWKINSEWYLQLAGNYDFLDQGAFPYGFYNSGHISKPDYNSSGSYFRQVAGGSINLKYENHSILLNSNTGFLYFDDDMKMDLDYSPLSVFKINQKQNEKSWTEEFTVKSNTSSNYQWLFGVFGFYNDLNTNVVTTMEKGAIQNILQPVFDELHNSNPRIPQMTIVDSEIPIPGIFKTPSYGGAIFHQSTYNNFFIEGLSVTAGIRLDYEKAKLDYNTHMDMNLDIAIKTGGPMGTIHMDSTIVTLLKGKYDRSFTEILPKVALKYEFNSRNYTYVTVSNGYKAGGYNIQSFADIVRDASQNKPNSEEGYVIDQVFYKPEYSWNYELGIKGELFEDYLRAELAVYCINVKDIQVTDFVESGQGRILKNAGKARSIGYDLSVHAKVTDELSLSLNYGFTRATFKDYKITEKGDDGDMVELNYSGNYIPFAPQNTLSVGAVYNKLFRNKYIDRLNIQAQYNAAGKIYWTETNDVTQKFYGLLNCRAGINKGIFGINLWANNVFNIKYAAFYFESMGKSLAQQGKPFTFGVDVNLAF